MWPTVMPSLESHMPGVHERRVSLLIMICYHVAATRLLLCASTVHSVHRLVLDAVQSIRQSLVTTSFSAFRVILACDKITRSL